MSDETTSPRAGSSADLVRRVDRLEAGQNELARSVASLESTTKLVQLEQSHLRELMTARFSGLEAQQAQQTSKLDGLISLVTTAMSDPTGGTPHGKALMEEYRAFQHETRTKQEEFEDYILVQKTKSETTANLAQRAFGSSLLGAIGGVIGIVLGVIALLGR